LTPGAAELAEEHAHMAANLAAAGADVILVETQPTIREAVAATQAARRTGLPVLVSFVCGVTPHLLSGEALSDAVQAIIPLRPAAILVNCGPARAMERFLHEMRRAAGELPIGCYANVGEHGWRNVAESPGTYAAFAESWLAAGAHLIGGCCGTGPGHVARLGVLIRGNLPASPPTV